jgi:CDP-diacylglycerol--glycerol-3-phosphate 3-phosphatidyltransferase
MVTLVVGSVFWWVPVAIIAVREFTISAFRSFWGRRGLAVPATQWAKVKTVVQEVCVGFALLPLTADHRWVADTTLWIAVVLTVTTGVHYIHAGSRVTRTTGS